MSTQMLRSAMPVVDDARWGEQLAAVVDHHARTGRWPAESSHDPATARLGVWLGFTRRAWRHGKLTPDRVERLERSGIPMRPIDEARWGERLAAVVDHHSRTGRWPAESAPDPATARLGKWLGRTRHARRHGELAPDRVERLDRSGIPMRPTRPYPRVDPVDDARWGEQLAAVMDHHARTGRWPTNPAPDPATARLGKWLENTRPAWRHGKLTPDRVERLDRSGIPLRPTRPHARGDELAR